MLSNLNSHLKCDVLFSILLKTGAVTIWTFKEWADRIQANFEKSFYVDENTIAKYVNKTGIYKDTFNSSQPWTDFQLRCNFPIAMVAVSVLTTKFTK
jgi:glycogen debranching enzyme